MLDLTTSRQRKLCDAVDNDVDNIQLKIFPQKSV